VAPSDRDRRGDESVAGDPQPAEVDRLRKEVEVLKLGLGRAAARIQKLETELDAARAQVAWFHRQLFGQKKERARVEELESAFQAFLREQEAKARGLPTASAPLSAELSVQILLSFMDPSARDRSSPEADETKESTPETATASSPAAPPASTKKKGHGRNRVPATLREETIVIEPDKIPEGARRIGADTVYRVGIQRAEMIRYAIVRPKYAENDEDETSTKVTVAEMPHEMITKGLFTPSGLAHIIADKWDRHVPWNRMARFFGTSGYQIPVSTLCGVSIRAAPLAMTLVEAMKAYAKEVAPYMAIDATGVMLLRKEVCLRGHAWVQFIEKVGVFVSFTKKHDSVAAAAQLDGWQCPTLADGAQVYDRKQRETGNARGGCWSHGRRNLIYAAPTDSRALVGVQLINDLFAIEREILDAVPEERLTERKRRSAPIVKALFEWRDDLLARGNLGRSLLAKALRYLRNQEERLKYFLSDGRVPIHNNMAELQARHIAVGRKGWMFFGSENGAEAGSVWLSLVLSARMHRLDVEDYLRDLFRVLPAWPKSRLLELAPHRWSETRARLDPLEMCTELGRITIPPPPQPRS
jgi:transposase